jgi:hypothetical protein
MIRTPLGGPLYLYVRRPLPEINSLQSTIQK